MIFITVKMPAGMVNVEQKTAFLTDITHVASKTLNFPIESIAVSIDDSVSYENLMVGGKRHVKPLVESLKEVLNEKVSNLQNVTEKVITKLEEQDNIKRHGDKDIIIDGLKENEVKQPIKTCDCECDGCKPMYGVSDKTDTTGQKVDEVLDFIGKTMSELTTTMSEKYNMITNKLSVMIDNYNNKDKKD